VTPDHDRPVQVTGAQAGPLATEAPQVVPAQVEPFQLPPLQLVC
jgi:hypothetical protein